MRVSRRSLLAGLGTALCGTKVSTLWVEDGQRQVPSVQRTPSAMPPPVRVWSNTAARGQCEALDRYLVSGAAAVRVRLAPASVGARVELWSPSGHLQGVVSSDSRGEALFRSVPCGQFIGRHTHLGEPITYLVQVVARGYGPAELTSVVPNFSDPVVIHLTAGRPAQILVRTPDGSVPTQSRVCLSYRIDGSPTVWMHESDADRRGVALFEDVGFGPIMSLCVLSGDGSQYNKTLIRRRHYRTTRELMDERVEFVV